MAQNCSLKRFSNNVKNILRIYVYKIWQYGTIICYLSSTCLPSRRIHFSALDHIALRTILRASQNSNLVTNSCRHSLIDIIFMIIQKEEIQGSQVWDLGGHSCSAPSAMIRLTRSCLSLHACSRSLSSRQIQFPYDDVLVESTVKRIILTGALTYQIKKICRQISCEKAYLNC